MQSAGREAQKFNWLKLGVLCHPSRMMSMDFADVARNQLVLDDFASNPKRHFVYVARARERKIFSRVFRLERADLAFLVFRPTRLRPALGKPPACPQRKYQ